MSVFDYGYARPIGSTGEYERVIDSDCPLDPNTLLPLGPDDCFKLENSGWCNHVEFKLKEQKA